MLRCRRVEDVPGRLIADFLRQQAPAASPTSDPAPDALPAAQPAATADAATAALRDDG